MVITSALHAEGPQFDPGRDQKIFVKIAKTLQNVNTRQLLRSFWGKEASEDTSSQHLGRKENFSQEMLQFLQPGSVV